MEWEKRGRMRERFREKESMMERMWESDQRGYRKKDRARKGDKMKKRVQYREWEWEINHSWMILRFLFHVGFGHYSLHPEISNPR